MTKNTLNFLMFKSVLKFVCLSLLYCSSIGLPVNQLQLLKYLIGTFVFEINQNQKAYSNSSEGSTFPYLTFVIVSKSEKNIAYVVV
jgi:hypothetical protein